MSFLLLSLISPLITLIIFIFIVRAIIHALRKKKNVDSDTKDLQNIFWSSDDGFSQIYYFISLYFFFLFIFNFNKAIGAPLPIESIILISTLITFIVSYLKKSVFLVPFAIIGIYMSVALYISTWLQSMKSSIGIFSTVIIFMVLSVALFAIGRIHDLRPKFKRFGQSYAVISLFPIGAFLFFFSSYSGLRLLEEVSDLFVYNSLAVSLTIVFLVVVLILAFAYGIFKKVIGMFEVISAALFTLIVLALTFVKLEDLFVGNIPTYGVSSTLSPSGVLWIFIFNALLFIFISGFIVLGYLRRESWAINVGTVLFVVFFIVKYVQFLVDSLSRSLLFIVGGVLLLVMGYILSKGRQKLLESIKTTNT